MANRPYLGVGEAFPPQITNLGRPALIDDSALIKQSLEILFNEPIGSELMREHYGSRLREALFEPNTLVLISMLDYYIVDAIEKWERRIAIVDIKYNFGNTPSVINCTVIYRIKQSSEIDSFIFPYYRQLKD